MREVGKLHGTEKARPTHYDLLGISPRATSEEIARAFASRGGIYQPHSFGGLAELCVAYETLKDPNKRTAYDASIGLKREQTPPSLAAGARWAAVAQAAKPAAPRERPVTPEQPPAAARPALPLGSASDSHVRPEPRIGRGDPPYAVLEHDLGVETRPVDWRKVGMALGAVVVAACGMGGLAGWWSASSISEAATPAKSVSLSIPVAEPQPTAPILDAAPAPASGLPIRQVERPKAATPRLNSAERMPVAPEPSTTERTFQEDPAQPSLVEQADPLSPAASASTASMPLPNKVIARTIQRIGYSCPSVSSIEPIDGEADGVRKITCSSGQSYQASPVNGRYRFRRLGSR